MKNLKAIICGILEVNGKILFLEKDGKLEIPWIFGSVYGDPINAIGQAYKMKTNVSITVGELVYEGFVELENENFPVIALRMIPKHDDFEIVPADGKKVVWFDLSHAKKMDLEEHTAWIKNKLIEV